MSHNLPGNPDAENLATNFRNLANRRITTEDLEVLAAQTNALMALAYEMRTANLIALSVAKYANGSAMFPGEIDEVRHRITTRLGLDQEDDQ